MPDILPVRMQDILHSRKSELRTQQINNQAVKKPVFKDCITADKRPYGSIRSFVRLGTCKIKRYIHMNEQKVRK